MRTNITINVVVYILCLFVKGKRMKVINFLAIRFADTFDLWRNKPVTAIYALIAIAILQLMVWALFNLLGFNYEFYQMLMAVVFGLAICLFFGWWCKRHQG